MKITKIRSDFDINRINRQLDKAAQ